MAINDRAHSVHIFLAEDNPADVYLIRQSLHEHGIPCQLDVASDGEQALHFLRHQTLFASGTAPALILLDLNLPKHDGIEVLQHVRQNQRLASVPVILLTSSDSPKDRLTATEL